MEINDSWGGKICERMSIPVKDDRPRLDVGLGGLKYPE
jgi:hypothetical protein